MAQNTTWNMISLAVHNEPVYTTYALVLLMTFARWCIMRLPLLPSAISSLPEPQRSTMKIKLCEAFWFFMYYSATFGFGSFYFKDAPWIWDTKYYWKESPSYSLNDNSTFFKLFYLLQLATYISASITVVFFKNARSNHRDKLVMLFHHFLTISLITASYIYGELRIGSVVMIIHDISDIFLEGAKIARYCGFRRLTNCIFTCFATVFFISRLILFPLRILLPIINFYPDNIYFGIIQYFKNQPLSIPTLAIKARLFWLILLGGLQCLHIYWFCLVGHMVLRAIWYKGVESDIRSDDETSGAEDSYEPSFKEKSD